MTEHLDYQMPFNYFRDDQVKILERTQPELIPPEDFYKAFIHTPRKPKGNTVSYLLNRKNRKLMDTDGMWKPPYHDAEPLRGHGREWEDWFVVCPGPSLKGLDLTALENKPVLAVNGGIWKVPNPLLCVIFESNFLYWYMKQDYPKGKDYIMAARSACRYRGYGETKKANRILVPRFEERRNMPFRTPAVTVMGAMTTAWWFGAKRIWVAGMDLSKPGQPYVDGIPRNDFGAQNPFDDQVKALRQFKLPGVEIFNCSPHSTADSFKLPFSVGNYEMLEHAAKAEKEITLEALFEGAGYEEPATADA